MTSDESTSTSNDSGAGSSGRVRHEWSDTDRPTTAVIEAVAATIDQDPSTMEPLYEHINPDALDAIMTPKNPEQSSNILVEFSYNGVDVRVSNQGFVDVIVPSTGWE